MPPQKNGAGGLLIFDIRAKSKHWGRFCFTFHTLVFLRHMLLYVFMTCIRRGFWPILMSHRWSFIASEILWNLVDVVEILYSSVDSVLIHYRISQWKNSGVYTYHERTATRVRIDAGISFLMKCCFRLENSVPRIILCFVRIEKLLRWRKIWWNIFMRGLIVLTWFDISCFWYLPENVWDWEVWEIQDWYEGGNRGLIDPGFILGNSWKFSWS